MAMDMEETGSINKDRIIIMISGPS
jgi:hypothetical protein